MKFYAKPKRLSLTPISVSISNGMEFYAPKVYSTRPLDKVSIPNGMEFYTDVTVELKTALLFQFPTDRLPTKFT